MNLNSLKPTKNRIIITVIFVILYLIVVSISGFHLVDSFCPYQGNYAVPEAEWCPLIVIPLVFLILPIFLASNLIGISAYVFTSAFVNLFVAIVILIIYWYGLAVLLEKIYLKFKK